MSLKEIIIRNFVDTSYCVGYRFSSDRFWKEEKSVFHLLKQSLRYWYADPIPCEIQGEKYVFLEQYDRLKNRGYIAAAKFKKKKIQRPKTVIKEDNHLSFPTVIQYKDDYYLIPESSETGCIQIYKMGATVEIWNHYYTIETKDRIIDISYVIEGETLLLLAGEEQENPLYSKRVVYQIEHLDDVHRLTCKIGYKDNRASLKVRNGGNIWQEGEERFIVTQESTPQDYGMYLLLQRIVHFSLHIVKMEEKGRKTIENIEIPGINKLLYRRIGTHTYGVNGDLEVVDVSLTKISLLPFLRKVGWLR